MKKYGWKIALGLGLVVAAVVVFFLQRDTEVDVVYLEERELVERLVVTGTVEPVERSQLSAQVPGRVLSVSLREGERFEEGDILVELDTQEAQASLRQAEAALDQARARLAAVTDQTAPAAVQDVEDATLLYEGAQQELERARQLVSAGVESEALLDQRQREFERAEVALERARTAMEEASPRGSAVAEATAAIRQAEAGRALAQVNLANHTVRAPFDGMILSRQVERGQTVQPGGLLFSVAAKGPLEVRIDPDEQEVSNLEPGQSAQVVADAFADQPMEARLDRIDPAADRERATVTAFLELVDEPPAGLRTDMTLSVDIELRRQPEALVLPLRALRGRATDEPYVLIADDGTARRLSVSIGLVGDDDVEITDGLSTSEPVIITADVAAGDGIRR